MSHQVHYNTLHFVYLHSCLLQIYSLQNSESSIRCVPALLKTLKYFPLHSELNPYSLPLQGFVSFGFWYCFNFISLYPSILYTFLNTPNSFLPQKNYTYHVLHLILSLILTILCTNSISSNSSITESCASSKHLSKMSFNSSVLLSLSSMHNRLLL